MRGSRPVLKLSIPVWDQPLSRPAAAPCLKEQRCDVGSGTVRWGQPMIVVQHVITVDEVPRRPHLRTGSKSQPAVVDIDDSSSITSTASSSSSRRIPSDSRERSQFRSWQYPASPEADPGDQGRLDAIAEDDGSPSRSCSRGPSPADNPPAKRGHQPTASLPYPPLHQSHGSVAAGAGHVLLKRGPMALFPYLAANIRRARYNDLLFGFLFLGCLTMFLSALGGVGYSTDPLKGGLAASPPARMLLPSAGLKRLAEAINEPLAEAIHEYIPAPLRIKPIPAVSEKDETPLFADVLPPRKPRPNAVPVPAAFSDAEEDSRAQKGAIEDHDLGRPELVAASPDDPRWNEEHADHSHHDVAGNIFGGAAGAHQEDGAAKLHDDVEHARRQGFPELVLGKGGAEVEMSDDEQRLVDAMVGEAEAHFGSGEVVDEAKIHEFTEMMLGREQGDPAAAAAIHDADSEAETDTHAATSAAADDEEEAASTAEEDDDESLIARTDAAMRQKEDASGAGARLEEGEEDLLVMEIAKAMEQGGARKRLRARRLR